jgi:hypothetical protein
VIFDTAALSQGRLGGHSHLCHHGDYHSPLRRKQRLRKVKPLIQDHTAGEKQSSIQAPSLPNCCLCTTELESRWLGAQEGALGQKAGSSPRAPHSTAPSEDTLIHQHKVAAGHLACWDTVQHGGLAPICAPHFCSVADQNPLHRSPQSPYLMNRVQRRKMMRPRMLGASHHCVW